VNVRSGSSSNLLKEAGAFLSRRAGPNVSQAGEVCSLRTATFKGVRPELENKGTVEVVEVATDENG